MSRFQRFETIVYRFNSVLVTGLVVGEYQDLDGEFWVVIQDPITRLFSYRKEADFPKPKAITFAKGGKY